MFRSTTLSSFNRNNADAIAKVIRKQIKELIRGGNIIELESYIQQNHIRLKDLNDDPIERRFDLLSYAMENEASLEIIHYLLQKVPYNTLDRRVLENEKIKNHLFSAIAKNNFKLVNLFLTKYKLDINWKNGDLIHYLYRNNFLNNRNLRYILRHGFSLRNISDFILRGFLETSNNDFLEIIFKHYIFDTTFILDLLAHYKHKEPATQQQLQEKIRKEKNKIFLPNEYYQVAVEKENYRCIKLFYEHDGSPPVFLLDRVFHYDLLEKAVKLNDLEFVERILTNHQISFKNVLSEELLIEANKNNNMSIMKLLVKTALNVAPKKKTIKWKEESEEFFTIIENEWEEESQDSVASLNSHPSTSTINSLSSSQPRYRCCRRRRMDCPNHGYQSINSINSHSTHLKDNMDNVLKRLTSIKRTTDINGLNERILKGKQIITMDIEEDDIVEDDIEIESDIIMEMDKEENKNESEPTDDNTKKSTTLKRKLGSWENELASSSSSTQPSQPSQSSQSSQPSQPSSSSSNQKSTNNTKAEGPPTKKKYIVNNAFSFTHSNQEEEFINSKKTLSNTTNTNNTYNNDNTSITTNDSSDTIQKISLPQKNKKGHRNIPNTSTTTMITKNHLDNNTIFSNNEPSDLEEEVEGGKNKVINNDKVVISPKKDKESILVVSTEDLLLNNKKRTTLLSPSSATPTIPNTNKNKTGTTATTNKTTTSTTTNNKNNTNSHSLSSSSLHPLPLTQLMPPPSQTPSHYSYPSSLHSPYPSQLPSPCCLLGPAHSHAHPYHHSRNNIIPLNDVKIDELLHLQSSQNRSKVVGTGTITDNPTNSSPKSTNNNTSMNEDSPLKPPRSKYDSRYIATVLNMVIRIGNLPLVQYIVEEEEEFQPVNVNMKDITKEYPIITALNSNHLEIFDYLLEKGASSNIKNLNGNSILNLAIHNNNYDMVKCLLDHGANMMEKDASDTYPLIKAINQNNFDLVRLLVLYGLEQHQNLNLTDVNGNTPIILSYRRGYLELFRFLARILDVNKRDSNGHHVLFYAVLKSDIPTINFLIHLGAEVNFTNYSEHSLLDVALAKGNKEVFLILLKKNNKMYMNVPKHSGATLLTAVIKTNVYSNEDKVDMIHHLIEKGANVNTEDISEHLSPLVYAIQKRSLEMVKVLVNHGANVNFIIKNCHLIRPVTINPTTSNNNTNSTGNGGSISSDSSAGSGSGNNTIGNSTNNHTSTGASVGTSSTSSGNTSSQTTSMNGTSPTSAASSNMNTATNSNMNGTNSMSAPALPCHKSILMLAIELGEVEMVKYLIESNADLNYRDDRGNSPWRKVIEGGNQTLLEYFTNYYMSNLKAEDVSTHIMQSQVHENRKLDVLKILVNHGMEVDLRTHQGNTLLACAITTGQNTIINYLVDCGANLYSVNNKGQSILDLCNEFPRFNESINRIQKLIRGPQ